MSSTKSETKILTDKDLGEIIWRATHDNGIIDDADSYQCFLEDLAELVCDHFGGDRGSIVQPDIDMPWTVAIRINECVPADGGIFKDYDAEKEIIYARH